MTAAEIIAIMQLVAVLAPEAIKLANNLVETFKDLPADERMKMLNDLKETLKPMVPK